MISHLYSLAPVDEAPRYFPRRCATPSTKRTRWRREYYTHVPLFSANSQRDRVRVTPPPKCVPLPRRFFSVRS